MPNEKCEQTTAEGLTRSDSFFESVLESAPDAMVIVDDDGHIVIVNGEAERMFGYARSELLGERIELLVPDRLRRTHIEDREHYTRAPRLRTMGAGKELYGRRKNGSEFPVEISLSPVSANGGTFVSSAIRDISVRKRLESAIVEARHTAERANKANRAFLAAASHDLRQPVQALSLLGGALRRTVTDEKALEMLALQEQSLTGMTNLLNSLLDISRLDAGAIVPRLQNIEIAAEFERIRNVFGRQAQQKNLAIDVQHQSEIVCSDANLLGQIIQNLVSNAIRYTEAGRIKLSATTTDDVCEISVEDSGIGIEADQLDAIFDEFHQCQSSGGNKEGFGLGLAIVHRLAELLGHYVHVRSTPGAGSRFTIAVPLTHATKASAATADDGQKPPSRSGHILLVEDDSHVANALQLLLETDGHTVLLASSLNEAISVVEHSALRPELIISDYHLAGPETGVQTIAAIRNMLGVTVPSFIVSGDTSGLVEETQSVQLCELISKPVDADILLRKVAHAIATISALR